MGAEWNVQTKGWDGFQTPDSSWPTCTKHGSGCECEHLEICFQMSIIIYVQCYLKIWSQCFYLPCVFFFSFVADFQRTQIDSIKKEIILLKCNCTCSEQRPDTRTETRKRRQEGEGLDGQPPLKKGTDSVPGAEKCLPAFVTTRGAGRENPAKGRRYLNGRKRLSNIKKWFL